MDSENVRRRFISRSLMSDLIKILLPIHSPEGKLIDLEIQNQIRSTDHESTNYFLISKEQLCEITLKTSPFTLNRIPLRFIGGD